jgi:hypothetical protein
VKCVDATPVKKLVCPAKQKAFQRFMLRGGMINQGLFFAQALFINCSSDGNYSRESRKLHLLH